MCSKPSAATAFPIPIVRVIVRNTEGRVLILKRQPSGYGAGQWCLPGGKVEYGETVEQAVRKELKEETSLDCLEATFLFYQDSLAPEPGKIHGINLYFACRTVGEIELNEESTEFRWISREELAGFDLAFRNQEGLERFWQEARGR